MWSFTLPRIIDPNNQTVKQSLQFNATFFTFDHLRKAIKQIKSFESPTEQTISIELDSKLGLASTYSFDVHFYCNETQTNFTLGGTFKASSKQNLPKGSFKQPDIENPVKLTISNITEYGLVTIVYNQKLHIDDKYIIVHYE